MTNWPDVRLRRVVPDAPWKADAACRSMHPDLFFFERGESRQAVERAKAICADCPVVGECREYGMAENFGIFGGLTENERRQVRRRRCARRAG